MNRRRRSRVLTAVSAGWLAALVVAAGVPAGAQQKPPLEDLSGYLPPGDGRALVAKVCSNCHDLRGTLQLRKDKAGWEAVVLDMGARGAQLTLDDIDPIVAYLATVFGPTAPPFVDVNTDPPDRLARVPGIAPAAAEALVAARARAPLTTADEVRQALGFDPPAFERVRHWLYVKPRTAAR